MGNLPADLDHAVATASTKLALFQSVLDLIDKLGAAAPVLYVVEGVQWSDRSTLDLVRYLATNALQERVLLVVTYRDHDIVAGTPVAAWLAELGRLPITDWIAVERLDPLHASELGRRVASAQGAPVDADRLAAALTRSAGNPLFIEHLLRPGAPTDALPVTLQDLLGARVSGLPPAALRLLAVVSTLGRPATTDLVAAVLSWPAADVEAAAHASLEQAVLDVRSGGTLGFAHPAFGEVVWSSLLPSERARLHRRGRAEVLATQADSVPGELARHWLGAGERAQALAASVAAGEAAERVYAFTDAAAAFDRALALADELGQVEARRGLLAKAAQASYLAGSTDAAIRHALELLPPPPATLPPMPSWPNGSAPTTSLPGTVRRPRNGSPGRWTAFPRNVTRRWLPASMPVWRCSSPAGRAWPRRNTGRPSGWLPLGRPEPAEPKASSKTPWAWLPCSGM